MRFPYLYVSGICWFVHLGSFRVLGVHWSTEGAPSFPDQTWHQKRTPLAELHRNLCLDQNKKFKLILVKIIHRLYRPTATGTILSDDEKVKGAQRPQR